ncbi:MAG: hypothetical protein IV086_07570 [Hyphomonadaceae bacterium]|nr:MAG: hypothetical protein FD160_1275 [Caulobacteraceae bacterium]MBT9445538.1 hypothetical protein [Hyphomonadaceae bacterium]TPW07375.1 MAG: hypothetical protein FD124_1211 [Alphaproteobacteria bacterium]
MRRMLAAIGAMALAGCAMLTAERPLLAPGDQDAAFALAEGLWAHREDDCTDDPAAKAPDEESCIDWVRVARESDGAWRIEAVGEDDPPMRLVVIPAVRTAEGRLAPLYVAEATSVKDPAPAYALIVPRGDLQSPVRRVAFDAISCFDLLRDGEPPDIVFNRDGDRLVGCTAKTMAAVQDAARRAVIETLDDLGDEELAFVRAGPE